MLQQITLDSTDFTYSHHEAIRDAIRSYLHEHDVDYLKFKYHIDLFVYSNPSRDDLPLGWDDIET